MNRLSISILYLSLSAGAYAQQLHGYALKDSMGKYKPVTTFAPVATTCLKNGQAIPHDFYAQHLGFFCRQELRLQQAHVPVAFRLGSMDYCNYLEQKPGYR